MVDLVPQPDCYSLIILTFSPHFFPHEFFPIQYLTPSVKNKEIKLVVRLTDWNEIWRIFNIFCNIFYYLCEVSTWLRVRQVMYKILNFIHKLQRVKTFINLIHLPIQYTAYICILTKKYFLFGKLFRWLSLTWWEEMGISKSHRYLSRQKNQPTYYKDLKWLIWFILCDWNFCAIHESRKSPLNVLFNYLLLLFLWRIYTIFHLTFFSISNKSNRVREIVWILRTFGVCLSKDSLLVNLGTEEVILWINNAEQQLTKKISTTNK